jgi:hypothetical protein
MNLAVIGQLNLLQQLFDKVFIPEAVLQELTAIGSEQLGNVEIQTVPWLESRSVVNRALVDALLVELHKGEAEAIALAAEMEADLLLLDERRGRKVASRLGLTLTRKRKRKLKCLGLLGILVEAKRQGLIVAVKPVLDDLMTRAGFWVGSSLYTRILEEAGEASP